MSSAKPTLSVWRLIRRFGSYLYPVRWQAALNAGLMLLSPLVAVLLLWLMKYLIDRVFVAKDISVLPTIAGAYVVLVATKLLIDYWLTRLDAAITELINQNVRVDLYRHLISVSPGSLKNHSVGDLLSHLMGDADRIENLIYSVPVQAISNIVTGGYFIGFLLILSWKLTLCALVTAPILVFLSWRMSPRARRLAKISRRKATAWFERAEERLGGTAVIQAFGAEATESQTFEEHCAAARVAALRSVALQAWLTLLIEIVGAGGGLLVLALGAHEMYVGNLTVGALVAFLGSVGSLYSPISSLAKTSGRLQRAAAGAQRVVELLDRPSLVVERQQAKTLLQVQGALEFSQVRFAYPGGPEVLHGVSLHVDPGETLAVVGPNGSGKSTLVQLALRLYDPSAGVVSIDGSDLRDVTLGSLRRAIAVVFQDPSVFRGSIRENIHYGRQVAPEENFLLAAEAAHVAGFATASRYGYATPIGPRGSWISGGQRQRLALARALLREAPILVLDEATASIDSEAEQVIQDAIEIFHGERSILVVSHRLSTVLRADRVVVLEEGRVVEMGSPAVLQRNPSRFRELFAAQIVGEKSLEPRQSA
jgi:ABC-type multidrug transport system fused ATPase/permease subunit